MTTKKPAGKPPEMDDPDDAPRLTAEFFNDAEVFRGDTFVRRGRGRPSTGNARELVSFRLDRDLLAKLREAGPGWQSQVNNLLRLGLALRGLNADGTATATSIREFTILLNDEAVSVEKNVALKPPVKVA